MSEAQTLEVWTPASTGKVIVVESEEDIARMLEVRLAREGHEVLVAGSLKEARERLEDTTIDVAVIDRTLSDGAGSELMDELLASQEPLEVIMSSVDPTVELVVEVLDKGAFDLVVKPFSNLKLLTHKVAKAVGKVRAERQALQLGRHVSESGVPLPREDSDFAAGIDLDKMSGVDPLTGLPNRQAAEERFRTETSRALRYDRPLCIAMCSVDELDLVIERFGREVADGVLRGIVQVFQAMVRDVDFIARHEGGEFFLLFPETAKDSGFVVVDRIRQKLLSTAFSDEVGPEGQFRLTASFGVAGLPTDTMNAEILREAADAALGRARATGGDQVVLYDAGMSRR